MSMEISRASIRKGFRIFAAITLVSLIALFGFTLRGESFSALRQIRASYLFLALFLSVGDWFLSASRIHVLVRLLSDQIGYKSSLRASLANLCMAAITPSQTGGGPAQILMLNREGLSMPKSIAVGVVTFMCTLVFMLILALALSGMGLQHFGGLKFQHLFQYGSWAFALVFGTFLIFFMKPTLFGIVMDRAASAFYRALGKAYHRPRWIQRLFYYAEECHVTFLLYLRKGKGTFLAGVGLTFLIFFNKFAIAWVVLKGVGLHPELVRVVLIQILILLIVYFSPSPGSSGAAELVSAALMARIVPREMLPVYTVLWRFFTLYLGVGVGGAMLLRYMGKGGRMLGGEGENGVEAMNEE
ncbi:MAG: flippase-like domain-containing protein [Candidatus Latescibacteria bacterium]|nr:flippase-like domain-containing protein [Candidatus Latescibacterota bacterium]